jgi:chemotaxis signal transduction protein
MKEDELLKARAARLAAPLPAHVEDEATSWIAEFRIGGDRHGVPLPALRSVVPLRRVTPVHLAPPHVVGVLRYQGQVITALSLSALLGGRGLNRDPSVLLVVDPGFGRIVALDCEHIPRPIALPAAAVEQAKKKSGVVVDVIAGDMEPLQLILVDRLLDRRTAARG